MRSICAALDSQPTPWSDCGSAACAADGARKRNCDSRSDAGFTRSLRTRQCRSESNRIPAALHPAEFLYKFEPYHNAPFALANPDGEVLQIAQAGIHRRSLSGSDCVEPQDTVLRFQQRRTAGPAENTGLLFSKPIRFSVGAFQLPGRTAAAIVDPNTNALLFVNTVSSFTPAQ